MVRGALTILLLCLPAASAVGDDFQREGTGDRRAKKDALENRTPPPLEVTGWINAPDDKLTLEDLRGKVVVIDFWGVWCGPCKAAMPHLKELYARHKSEGLEVIGVHTTRVSEKMAEYVAEQELPWPVAADVERKTVTAFAVDSYPDYYLIDRAGNLRVADLANKDVDRVVALLLKETPTEAANAVPIHFTKKPLLISPNEGCVIADVNQDDKLDVIAGPNWFAAPDFTPRPLRDIGEFRDDYLKNNGDHVVDVDGDGWLDVVSGEWLEAPIHWYKNPGAAGLAKGLKWKQHLLATGRGENEAYFLRDLDGDGTPELLVDCWIEDAPLVCWKFTQSEEGSPALERIELGPKGNGHGMAFGDVNGDGREDILCEIGWYERPEGDALAQTWKLHRDWTLKDGACPFIVTDLNGDGRNDLIWGAGHDYGLLWYEQMEPTSADKTAWKEHLIDRSYSQTHCLHWADLNGDGQPELITGKRVRGHAGSDPGGGEPECLYYYTWDRAAARFTRHTISEGEGIGTGMQICTADLNGDGRTDIAVSGKSGTWVLLNEGR